VSRRVITFRGADVPAIGLGTWELKGELGVARIADALAIGYRHIDTAANYRNEVEVGRALARSAVPRDAVWLTSKVWFTEFAAQRVRASVEASLARLGVDRLDLVLMHWPARGGDDAPTLREMTRLRDEGIVREIGVSNFDADALHRALEVAPIFCDQVKYHVGLAHDGLRAVAAANDVLLTAYSPLGAGRDVIDHPLLVEIAQARAATPAQVALRWLVEQDGVCAIPRSSSQKHLAENLDVWHFELSDDDRARIDALAQVRQAPFEMIWDRPGYQASVA
jgi:2,5-diketo-D-gluconate reductase B